MVLLHLHIVWLGCEGQQALQRIIGLGDQGKEDFLDGEVLPRDGGGLVQEAGGLSHDVSDLLGGGTGYPGDVRGSRVLGGGVQDVGEGVPCP